jgi:hypothetical protein
VEKIACPFCRASVLNDGSQAGKTVACPSCGGNFPMPPLQVAFDPYYKWLGIPPNEQPPNHYRLLGITIFESDPDVIDRAADGRMALLRTTQTGPNAQWTPRLLSEIATARVCLLNAQSKANYDGDLREQMRPRSDFQIGTIIESAKLITPTTSKRSAVRREDSSLVTKALVPIGGVAGLAFGYFICVQLAGPDALTVREDSQQASVRSNKQETRNKTTPGFPKPNPNQKPRPSTAAARKKPTPEYKSELPNTVIDDVRPTMPIPAIELPLVPAKSPEFAVLPALPPDEPAKAPMVAIISPPADPVFIRVKENGTTYTENELIALFGRISKNLVPIQKLDTEAKQEAAHIKMITDLNERIRTKIYRFHCPLAEGKRSVSKIVNNHATVELGDAVEARVVEGASRLLRRISIGSPKWDSQKILSIDAMDSLEVSGKPLVKTEQRSEYGMIMMSVPLPAIKTEYFLYLRDVETKRIPK